MNITDFISPNRTRILKASCRDEALSELVSISRDEQFNLSEFYDALIQREEILSTAIGSGMAFPHAKLDDIPHFFISIGISKDGLDWQAFDSKKTHITILIGGPQGQQEKYLKILAKISSVTRNEQNRLLLIESIDNETLYKNFISILKDHDQGPA